MMLPIFRRIINSPCWVQELLAKYSIPKKRIVVDFSSPNIPKKLHMGNLRSTMVGNFLQRLLRLAGHEVVSLNYVGDWGTQFAILACYWSRVMDGQEGRAARPSEAEWRALSARERVDQLTAAYVAANRMRRINGAFAEEVRKLQLGMQQHWIQAQEQGRADVDLDTIPDADVREAFLLWRDWRATSRDYLDDFYARFDVTFDAWDGESAHVAEGARLCQELIDSGKCRPDKENHWIARYPETGPAREKITLRKGDNYVYISRELGAIHARHRKYNADEYLYVVEQQQSPHFNQLKRLLALRGEQELADRVVHITFGHIVGLSTRQGINDTVDFLLEQGKREALEYLLRSHTCKADGDAELDAASAALAKSTLIFELFKRQRHSEFRFSYRGTFHPNGSNANILHQKYSRLNSLQLAHTDHMERIRRLEEGEDWRLNSEMLPAVHKLASRIQEFDTVVLNALTKRDPNTVAIYLLKLANQVGSSMAELRVQDQPLAVALPRLMLFSAAKKVLGEGMHLLGIRPLERM